MDDLSVYEIIKRTSSLENCLEEQKIPLRDNCIFVNLEKDDNILQILNKCYKEIRNKIFEYIKEELQKENFIILKTHHYGEGHKSINAKKNDIFIEIEYRILTNNLSNLKYSIKKGNISKTKKFVSINNLFDEIKGIENAT